MQVIVNQRPWVKWQLQLCSLKQFYRKSNKIKVGCMLLIVFIQLITEILCSLFIYFIILIKKIATASEMNFYWRKIIITPCHLVLCHVHLKSHLLVLVNLLRSKLIQQISFDQVKYFKTFINIFLEIKTYLIKLLKIISLNDFK